MIGICVVLFITVNILALCFLSERENLVTRGHKNSKSATQGVYIYTYLVVGR